MTVGFDGYSSLVVDIDYCVELDSLDETQGY